MAISTLVVGLGGTGVLAIRALRHLYEESLDAADRVPASFLAIDFDRSSLEASDEENRFADLQEDEFLYLNPSKIQELLRNIDRAQDGGFAWKSIRDWFPDTDRTPLPVSDIEANGARQMRALGRVGFFLNDEVIETSLRRKLNDLANEVDLSTLSNSKRVILISSLAGGTGAGMLIDLAYVVRRLANRPKIFLYLLLPEVFQDVDTGGRIFQNSYAMLKELAYLKDQQLPFHAHYPRIAPLDVSVGREEPFSRIYLLRGRDGSGSRAIREACIHMARTVVSQLHRVVQEKTLSIVANALSTSEKDEQLRRRTHCFSSAGNALLPLNDLRLSPSAVIVEVLRILREPERLRQTSDDLATPVRLLHDRIRQEARYAGTPPKESESDRAVDSASAPTAETQASEALPLEARVLLEELNKLAVVWTREIKVISQSHAAKLMEKLRAVIVSSPTGSSSESAKTASTTQGPVADNLEDRMENLKILLGKPNSAEAYSTLKKMFPEALSEFEGELEKTFEIWLQEPADSVEFSDVIRRWRFYSLLTSEKTRFPVPDSAWDGNPQLLEEFEASNRGIRKIEAGLASWIKRRFNPATTKREIRRRAAEELAKTLQRALDSNFQTRLEVMLRAHAVENWHKLLDRRMSHADDKLKTAREMARLLPRNEAKATPLDALPADIRRKFFSFLGRLLPDVIHKLSEGEPGRLIELESEISTLVRQRLRRDRDLQGARFVLPQSFQDELHRRLVEVRQRVFERRTPNPQRIGFALIFLPTGIVTKDDRQSFESMLSAAATMILESRTQVERYEGRELWIYYEELFNPPDHIWNLDEYFRRYQSEPGKEFFHIDRRFLSENVFRDINSAASGAIATCGNSGCRENIAHVQRGERICPGCGRMIRSRCGNKHCYSDEIHHLSRSHPPAKNCPVCLDFNHAAWWVCQRHGNLPTHVPIDKERCPECVREHNHDPHGWPKECVSVRPDLQQALKCPNCVRLNPDGSEEDIFTIPTKLKPYYHKGVNGHDFELFRETARLHRLSEDIRCPKCWTLLIPTHDDQKPRRKCHR